MWKTKWRKLCVVTMASSLKALLVLHNYGRARKKTGLDGGVFSPQYGASVEIVDCTGYDRAARLACALRARSGVFNSSSSYTRTDKRKKRGLWLARGKSISSSLPTDDGQKKKIKQNS
jgi:hypothetical protein